MSFFNTKGLLFALAIAFVGAQWAGAQGCVAAHSNQRSFDELITGGGAEASPGGGSWIHNLTIDIGYRVFNSNKYFQGSTEIPRASAIENHQNIFDVAFQYQLSHRWSIIGDIPVFNGSRNQLYPPDGIFRVSGLGDITVGVESWLFRPPTEHGGNIAINAQIKLPTGKDKLHGACNPEGARPSSPLPIHPCSLATASGPSASAPRPIRRFGTRPRHMRKEITSPAQPIPTE